MTTTTEVTIYGPNLRDQSKGSFHVHAAGCAHGSRYPARSGWDVAVASRIDATLAVYEDIISDDPDYYTPATIEADLVNDLHFAPCLRSLPFGKVPEL